MQKISKLIHGDTSPYEGFEADPTKVDMQGWGSNHPIFERQIKALKPSLILEVGTWKGGSAIGMARIARDLGLETEIVCIDTWLGNWQHWARRQGVGSIQDLQPVNGYPTLYRTFMNNVICADLSSIITPFPLPGYSAYKFFEDAKVAADIVYIDGDHEYEGVHLDLRTYWNLVKPGGVLIGDDIKWPGVKRAVKELFTNKGLAVSIEDGKFWISKET